MGSRFNSLGFKLRKHRNLMGYSIRDAAKLIGIGPIRLSQWERDIRKPSIKNLVKLAVLYRVLVDELCHDLRKDAVKTMEGRFKITEHKQKESIKEKPP